MEQDIYIVLFAKVVVMEVAMVRVNHPQREEIQQYLEGNLKDCNYEKDCRTGNCRRKE
ncbi:MAG: hypothetical protein J6K24_00690 [Tidjanibacter sp.]|nr:hypothetical protein [Tidjanibacter sp.]